MVGPSSELNRNKAGHDAQWLIISMLYCIAFFNLTSIKDRNMSVLFENY